MKKAIVVSQKEVELGEVDAEKGRSFEGILVASVEKSGEKAPLFAAFAVSEGQYKPFWANLRTGREVAIHPIDGYHHGYGRHSSPPKMVFPVKEGLAWPPPQRTRHGHLMQIYNPRWFHFSQGRVEGTVSFCMMPRVDRLAKEQERAGQKRKAVRAHFQRLAEMHEATQEERTTEYGYRSSYRTTKNGLEEQEAYCRPFVNILAKDEEKWGSLEAWSELLCAFLSQRSGLPMPLDVRFFAQVCIAMKDRGVLKAGDSLGGITMYGLDDPAVGLMGPEFCQIGTDTLREFLARHVSQFEKATR